MFGIDDALIGIGLSTGGSLLSGLGAASAAKKQAKVEAAYQYQNYLLQVERNNINNQRGIELIERYGPASVAADAKTAGFNPATWLGAMGGMYSGLTAYGEQLRVGQDYMQSAPTTQVPSVMQAFGSALSSAGSGLQSYAQNNARIASDDRTSTLQYVAAVQRMRANGNPMAGLGTPFFVTTASPVTGGGAAAALSLGSSSGPYKDGKHVIYGTDEPPAGSLFTPDPSVGRESGLGWGGDFLQGLWSGLSGMYRTRRPNHNLGADLSQAAPDWMVSRGYGTSGPIDESFRRSSPDKLVVPKGYNPPGWGQWLWDQVFDPFVRPAY